MKKILTIKLGERQESIVVEWPYINNNKHLLRPFNKPGTILGTIHAAAHCSLITSQEVGTTFLPPSAQRAVTDWLRSGMGFLWAAAAPQLELWTDWVTSPTSSSLTKMQMNSASTREKVPERNQGREVGCSEESSIDPRDDQRWKSRMKVFPRDPKRAVVPG